MPENHPRMPRDRRTAAHLASMVSTLLQNHPDCVGIRFDGKIYPVEPDMPGDPSWGYEVDFSGHKKPSHCARLVAELIGDLQDRYDIDDEGAGRSRQPAVGKAS